MNNKTISKGFFLAAIICAVIMVLGPFAQSFSQNDFLTSGPLLRYYLGFGSLGYAFIAANSVHRNDWFLGVRYGIYYLAFALAFLSVNAFSLETHPLAHKIATGIVAVLALGLPWGINSLFWGWVCFLGLFAADVYFLDTFLNDGDIASGELAISLMAVIVTWIIINEKQKK